ncbi:DUF5801 repeats-in-toxin domain-containing protein, partial [Halomonas alkalisoli]|uniref:DUF5801 repeats-in-toxin domain-containing protein n=1 Tax=Halomonas alkalisoli TaxID=2907158 RepID=UPI001F411D48
DGPTAAMVTPEEEVTLTLDESPLPDDGDGIRTASADFTVYFASGDDVDYGSDGPGSEGYALKLTGSGVGSGLYAVDPDKADGKGEEILLYQSSDTLVEGKVDDQVYFTISVDSDPESATFGHVTFTQIVEPGVSVWHSDATDHDDTEWLTVDGTQGEGEGDDFVPNSLTLVQTVTDADGDSDTAEVDLGDGVFAIEDDGPELQGIEDGLVDFMKGETTGDSGFLDYGNDGAKSFVITEYSELPEGTILGEVTSTLSEDGTTLLYSNEGGGLFKLTLGLDGSYLFKVLQDAPLLLNDLDFGSVTPGGPKELEIVQGEQGSTTVVFDGFLSTEFGDDPIGEYDSGNLTDPGATADDVNISNKGIGLKDNQMDPGEQLKFTIYEDYEAGITKEVEGVQLVIDGGTGPNTTFSIRMVAYDSEGEKVADEVFDGLALPKGSNTLEVNFQPGESFHEVYFFHDLENDNNGFRIKSIALFEREEVPDFEIDVDVLATDGDGDSIDGSFSIGIDGNGDGEIDIPESLDWA